MSVVACYAVHNEEAQIAESLRSVKAYVDRYVVIDSVFDTNPIDASHSTDRTRQICERVCAPTPLTYIASDRKLSEEAARNLYLDNVPVGDWAFVIDGDEALYGVHVAIGAVFATVRAGWGMGPLAVPVYTTAVLFEGQASEMGSEAYEVNPTVNTCGWQPRLFANTGGVRYRGIGLYDIEGSVAARARETDAMFIINHHVRQSYAAYQSDYVWETGEKRLEP